MYIDKNIDILIVDDNKSIRMILKNILRMLGFKNSYEAEDGSMAFQMMKAYSYGLVLSDWNMEPITGLQLLKEIRSNVQLQKTPFIMITAESGISNLKAAKAAGVTDYIVKPFDAKIVGNKIISAIKRSQ
ncbi:two-component system response regulator [Magnetospirillum sp. ME-1]|uniref:response regulator n=1 Tax=Magnetospirillum sp. ME-1 TaxID=1639348 RepID=UPI000A17B520|nr:response regulator [Magnetospirillum sp. ME-1]ARJ67624.1 two-component system response regulator [Magnetospirillum sp. ME-1]